MTRAQSRSTSRSQVLTGQVVLLLALATAVAGCSSDDSEKDARSATSTSQQPHAASSAQTTATVKSLVTIGLKQITAGPTDAATATFQKVVSQDPDNVYGHDNLGYLAQLRGDDSTAIASYTQVLAGDKDFSPALSNLALLTEQVDLPAAVTMYRHEVAIKPDDAAAFMRLGFALQHLGQTAQGQQMLDQGIALDPSMASVTAPTYS